MKKMLKVIAVVVVVVVLVAMIALCIKNFENKAQTPNVKAEEEIVNVENKNENNQEANQAKDVEVKETEAPKARENQKVVVNAEDAIVSSKSAQEAPVVINDVKEENKNFTYEVPATEENVKVEVEETKTAPEVVEQPEVEVDQNKIDTAELMDEVEPTVETKTETQTQTIKTGFRMEF